MKRAPLVLLLTLVTLVALVAATSGCRLIAGIHDIELEDSGAPAKDGATEMAPAGDGSDTGPCKCTNCTILAANQDLPFTLQIVGDTIYWINYGSGKSAGSIMSVPKTGGSPKKVVSGLTQPYGLQFDQTNLYWEAIGETGKGIIEKFPIKGGTVETLASDLVAPMGMVSEGISEIPSAQLLAVSDTDVYFATYDTSGDQSDIDSVPIKGGPVAPFLTHLAGEGSVAVVQAYALTLVGTSLFVIIDNLDFSGIIEAPLSGAPVKTLISDLAYPLAIAVTGKEVLWCDDEANFANGFVNIASIGGSSFKTLGMGLAAPWSVVTDSENAYWANSGNSNDFGSVQKAPLDGSTAAVNLVPDALSPQDLVLDDKFIYWVDSACGGVIRAPK
jgi:hypothetical protein